MKSVSAIKARLHLNKLLDDATANHEPLQILGKRNNAALISEDDWRSIEETLYLLSIPDMRDSIRKGMQTDVGGCAEGLDW